MDCFCDLSSISSQLFMEQDVTVHGMRESHLQRCLSEQPSNLLLIGMYTNKNR